ncbi:MAG TPA: glycosyltransferase family 2 protein [Bacilli bacterium]
MRPSVSIVIPAWNEAPMLPETLKALRTGRQAGEWDEIVVVDDGSTDDTYAAAVAGADTIIRHKRNYGKGKALEAGWRNAKGTIIVFLDADLGASADFARILLSPLFAGQCDMSIATFPANERKGGFGICKKVAAKGIHALSGYLPVEPLSGQRAVRRELLEQIGGLSGGFGIEVGLTIDAARFGFRIREVPVSFRHRETGRDLQGFLHRGRQLVAVSKTLFDKWRHPVC